jgi:hypothetical protein
MFVRYYLELALPAAVVEEALLAAEPEWLSAVAGAAQARGDGLLGAVGVGPLGPRLGRRVRVELGAPVRLPSLTSLPLSWEPVGRTASWPAWTPPWSWAPGPGADPAGPQRPLPPSPGPPRPGH